MGKTDTCRFCMVLYCQHIWPAARGKPYDEMIMHWVWHIPYLFKNVQGLLLALAQNTKYQAPFSLLLSFCLHKSITKILGLPTRCMNPGPLVQKAGNLTTWPLSCIKYWWDLLIVLSRTYIWLNKGSSLNFYPPRERPNSWHGLITRKYFILAAVIY